MSNETTLEIFIKGAGLPEECSHGDTKLNIRQMPNGVWPGAKELRGERVYILESQKCWVKTIGRATCAEMVRKTLKTNGLKLIIPLFL